MQVPKPNFSRRKPKRGERGKFSKKTRNMIIEREDGRCKVCGAIGTEIHHVLYRSRQGRGVFTNGMLLCQLCHKRIHKDADLTNYWIDRFREMYGHDFWKDMYDL